MTSDDELSRIEDALAAMPPAGERILAGIGAGDYSLQTTLLATMPTGTAELLCNYRALTKDRQLTDIGVKLAEYAAFRHGFAPDPAVRAMVVAAVARLQAETDQPRSGRRWTLRRGNIQHGTYKIKGDTYQKATEKRAAH